MNTLEKYLHDFVSLKTATIDGNPAPYKSVLLLAIMELISEGIIENNHIVLSEELVTRFNQILGQYINKGERFPNKIATPFWHLKNEPFYHLYFNDGTSVKEINNPYSIAKLRECVYASFDSDLFKYIQSDLEKEELSAILFVNYLDKQDCAELSLTNKMEPVDLQEHLIHMVIARDAESLTNVLIECSGSDIPKYRNAVKEIIASKLNKEDIWWLIKFVLKTNPTLFKLPIIEALSAKTIDSIIVPNINAELASIVELLFKEPDKVSQDIDFLYLFRDYYKEKMPNSINKLSCSINQPESFFKLFEIYNIHGKNKVTYLLNIRNEASLFAICQLFADYNLQSRMPKEELKVFQSIDYKKSIYNNLKEKSDCEKLAKKIILSSILPLSISEQENIDKILSEGYEMFHKQLHSAQAKKEHIERVKEMEMGKNYLASLVAESVNHYLVHIKGYGVSGLLPKKYSKITGFKENAVVTVQLVGVDKNKKLYFVTQSECNMDDIYSIPLANIGDEVVISYFNEGKTCNVSSGCLKQINPIVFGQKEHFDYKAKYPATIVGRRSYYDYVMQIKPSVFDSTKGTIRLSKAAKELNIGIVRLVTYLRTKGYYVQNSPNQKINEKQYQMLMDEFRHKNN